MGNRAFVINANDVLPFSLRETAWHSQVVIGPDGAKSGMGDEAYYVLRGHAKLHIAPEIGSSEREIHEVGPDTAVFIPAGTFHRLDNTEGTEDLVLLTFWDNPPAPGSNGIHDARLKAWGTTFRLREKVDHS
jgi:mannose-6-phosphate isomerase-like protein (cupin superfamily)